MIGVHLYRLRGRYIRVKSTVFSGPKSHVWYLRIHAVLSAWSIWNPSKQEQFRPPGKLVHRCIQSLASMHSLISDGIIIFFILYKCLLSLGDSNLDGTLFVIVSCQFKALFC